MSYIQVTNKISANSQNINNLIGINFDDISKGLSDGSKDIRIASISASSITASGSITGLNISATSQSHVEADTSNTTLVAGGSFTDIVYSQERKDVLSEFDGTVFTAQTAGVYSASAECLTSDGAWASGNGLSLFISKNNSTSAGSIWGTRNTPVQYAITSDGLGAIVSVHVTLLAGETLRVKGQMYRTAGNLALNNDGKNNYFHVIKVN